MFILLILYLYPAYYNYNHMLAIEDTEINSFLFFRCATYYLLHTFVTHWDLCVCVCVCVCATGL